MECQGIDVSKHQKEIDWAKVKAAGIKFAIIRAGYGQSTEDPYFLQNIEGCIKNNIPVGVYWFMYCINEAEAIANANKCHAVIQKYKKNITMKVWCDFEYDTDDNAKKRGVTHTKASRTNCVMAFIKKMEALGYEVGNYANPDYIKNKFNKIDRPLWLAEYSSKKSYDCLIWQHTSKAVVNGISGYVDKNIYYKADIVDVYNQAQFIAEVEKILGVATVADALKKTVTISATVNNKHALVKPIQKYFNSQGFNCGTADGIAGKKFTEACKAYQACYGLISDGEITAKANTWKKLLGII